MSDENKILNLVVSDFPSLKREITSIFCESSSFIEICEDYALCKNSIEQFKLKHNPKFEKELRVLESVLTELKTELLSKLN